MNRIITDFFQLGGLRIISRLLMGVRGLIVVTGLTPYYLGEYTIWLLFIFYFTIFDFGVLAGLERDIPHYKGAGDEESVKKTSDKGWSVFFYFIIFCISGVKCCDLYCVKERFACNFTGNLFNNG